MDLLGGFGRLHWLHWRRLLLVEVAKNILIVLHQSHSDRVKFGQHFIGWPLSIKVTRIISMRLGHANLLAQLLRGLCQVQRVESRCDSLQSELT